MRLDFMAYTESYDDTRDIVRFRAGTAIGGSDAESKMPL
jgi:hypothetical protein